MTLERNYRSTQPILAAANAVIAGAAERFTKNLWTERRSAERPALVTVRDETGQADYVVDRVLEAREAGVAAEGARRCCSATSHHSEALELELMRRNIPFVKFGGLKFLEAAHVKDLLAVLRLAENPRDRIAGFRVLQLLPGVGPATAERGARRHGAMRRAAHGPALAFPSRRGRGEATGRTSSSSSTVSAPAAAWPAEVDRRARLVPSRISSGCTRTPACGAPTCGSSSGSPPATHRASAS